MSRPTGVKTRSPADVGYVPWLLQRASAVLLVVLIGVHIAVQVYGYAAPYQWGVYGGLLDLTLGLVLLHGFLGVRATVLETRLSDIVRRSVIWAVGLAAIALFVARVFLIA